jgi:hypothetical protein
LLETVNFALTKTGTVLALRGFVAAEVLAFSDKGYYRWWEITRSGNLSIIKRIRFDAFSRS